MVCKKALTIAFIGIFLTQISLEALTLVYNIRVRRSFNVSHLVKDKKYKLLLSGVPIFFHRSSHIVDSTTHTDVFEKRNVIGSLFDIRYMPSNAWWAEITTGLEHDKSTFTGTNPFKTSRTGWDDIVFCAGHRTFIGERTQFVVYGIGGIPTRTKVELTDVYGPLVGTRFYNLGFGLEGSYAFVQDIQRAVAGIIQTRFLHSFNRSWTPILPEGSRIVPGNVTDIVLTGQWREKYMLYEGGYDATIFSNQAVMLPTVTQKANPFVRHSLFVSAARGWTETFFGKPFILGAGFTYAFTNKFDARTYTGWITASVAF